MIFLLLLLVHQDCLAQEKKLKEVKIKHRRAIKKLLTDDKINSFAPGMKIVAIDSQWMAQYALQNLSQLLSQQVPVFVKSYGINSMATLNFRGSSSAQSQVLWNGVPLNSASSGMTDVSMLGVNNFEQINIAYGGSSALLGSANVGAALLLDNEFSATDSVKKWQTKLSTEAGSFDQYKLGIRQQYATKKMFVSLKFMQQQAKNNFEYQGLNGQKTKLNNAHFLSNSTMLNFGYLLSSKTHLKFATWYQEYDREIPPALFEVISTKQQKDKALRFLLDIETNIKNNKLYAKSSFSREEMKYKDEAIGMSSQNIINQYYQEMGWKKKINTRHEFLLFIPTSIAWTIPANDSQTRYQRRIAVASAYRYHAFQEKLQLAINARAEQINSQSIFLSGANAAYFFHPYFKVRANIQSSYRAPTLNEWYYQPGGNINLKPERGWNTDAGYELKIPIENNWSIQHDVSLFHRQIKDWIMWFGGSIWTPHNIAKVYSRGLETSNKLIFQETNWSIYFGINTSFVLATTRESYLPNDGSIGKQIPYSPRYNGQSNIGASFKKISFNYNHTYTGYRFTTTDESQYLQPYQTGNFYASYLHPIKKLTFSIHASCNNAWNVRYQVVNSRPMPGRNWGAGLSLVF